MALASEIHESLEHPSLGWSGPPREGRHETLVDGIELPRITLPNALGVGKDLDGLDEVSVGQMVEKGVHGVLAHRDALRAKIVVEPVRAHQARWCMEDLPGHAAQSRRVGDAMALDHVAEDGNVDVVLEHADPTVVVQLLHFRKAPRDQEPAHPVLEQGPLLLPRLATERTAHFHTGVAEHLGEIERKDLRGERASPHAGRNLATEQLRRRTTQAHVDVLRVEQAPYEALPARNDLDLVEEERALAPAELRGPSIERID
jgi:hypothetical protein